MGQCSVCSGSEPIQPETHDSAAWPDENFDHEPPIKAEKKKGSNRRFSVALKNHNLDFSSNNCGADPSSMCPRGMGSMSRPAPQSDGVDLLDELHDDHQDSDSSNVSSVVHVDAHLTPASSVGDSSSGQSMASMLGRPGTGCSNSSRSDASLANICSTIRRNQIQSNFSNNAQPVTAEEVLGTTMEMSQRIMKEQADKERPLQSMVLDLILYLQLPRKLISLNSRETILKQEAQQELDDMSDSEMSNWVGEVTGMGSKLSKERNSNGSDQLMKRRLTLSGDNEDFDRLEKRITMMSQPELQRSKTVFGNNKLVRSMTIAFNATADAASKVVGAVTSMPTGLRSTKMFRMMQTNKELHQCFNKISRWEFNAFELMNYTNHPLTLLSLYAMNLFNLFETFDIKLTTWMLFIEKIEATYRDNPYHNSIHAADVLASQLYWLTQSEDVVSKLEPIDYLTCIIGAAIHDVGHPGTTSDFEIRTSSDIAIQYNDTSVLENYHLSVTFNIIKRKKYNIFSNFSDAVRTNIRRALIDMVLTTDVSKHLEHVALVKDYLLQKEILETLNNKADTKQFGNPESRCRVSMSADKEIDTSHFMSNGEVRALLRNISLKVSDLSNPSRPLSVALLWTERIITEFHNQGDNERALGLTVTPMMDRTLANIELSQLAFIDHIIIPLYESWLSAVKEASVPISNLVITRNYWILKAEEKTGTEQVALRKRNQHLHKLLNQHYQKFSL